MAERTPRRPTLDGSAKDPALKDFAEQIGGITESLFRGKDSAEARIAALEAALEALDTRVSALEP